MKHILIGTLAAALLAACGGSGGDDGGAAQAPSPNAPGGEVPLTATQDAAAAQAFVASLVAAPSETAEPLGVGPTPLATSETDEPKPL